jgi:predicted nucleic acid-binding protein
LHWRAMDLAERFSLPAVYDAHYLALAERLGGEFWTADRRLVEAVQGALPWVRLVG